jgi:23S rRNA pseudouridine1911/1915/1917 synthase
MNNEPLFLTPDAPGERLDSALARVHPALSRVQWQKLIREGLVTLAGEPVKASLRLQGDETLAVLIPEVVESDIVAEALPLDVCYADEDVIVINKSADMVVHPSVGNERGTLVNALLHHFPTIQGIGGEKRPGIVHRLDKGTSGLIVVARNDHALRHLQGQFQARTVHKLYLALVEGLIQPERAEIDAPIGRSPIDRKRMAVIAPGSRTESRPARTGYELVQTVSRCSLVRCTLHTGRTHQIRVHLAWAGYPVVGDYVYGRQRQRQLHGRHFLHATELGFTHPRSGEWMLFSAELPPDLQALLDQLAGSSS